MNPNFKRTLVVLGSAAALAAPAAATAKQGASGKGKGPDRAATKGPKFSTVIFKGTVASVDGSTVTVAVEKGNSRGRTHAGQELVLDLASARISVADLNADGARDVADVAAGDRFVAQVRVPRGVAIDPAAALVARRFVDVGPPEVDDDDAADEETEEG